MFLYGDISWGTPPSLLSGGLDNGFRNVRTYSSPCLPTFRTRHLPFFLSACAWVIPTCLFSALRRHLRLVAGYESVYAFSFLSAPLWWLAYLTSNIVILCESLSFFWNNRRSEDVLSQLITYLVEPSRGAFFGYQWQTLMIVFIAVLSKSCVEKKPARVFSHDERGLARGSLFASAHNEYFRKHGCIRDLTDGVNLFVQNT
nr:hypothetical protein [Tanacetum cinerariifolium]